MARHGIGILHLQGIVIRVGFHLLHPFPLHGDIGIIFENGIEKAVVIRLGQCRRIAVQRIQQKICFQFEVVVIGKFQCDIRKTETIQFAGATHAAHHRCLAVGYKVHLLLFFRPVIIIFRHHQQVARIQFIFPPKYPGANAVIVDIGTLVGAAYHNRLVQPVAIVTRFERIYQFIARQNFDVGKPRNLYLRQSLAGIFGNQLAQARSVPQNTRLLFLAYHLGQVHFLHLQSVAFQGICKQSGTLLLAHRRKLCRISHQQKAASHTRIDKLHQIVQQTPRAECRTRQTVIGNHRRLIDNI